MLKRFVAITAAALIALGSPLAVSTAAADNEIERAVTAVAVPVTGTTNNGATFEGTATINRFVRNDQGQLVAVGTLTGVISGGRSIVGAFSALVTPQQASCEILDLVIGPISLDLLGLVVTTNQIELNITAVPGSGNLLGNLLCSVAGLLDGTGNAQRILDALNRLLTQL